MPVRFGDEFVGTIVKVNKMQMKVLKKLGEGGSASVYSVKDVVPFPKVTMEPGQWSKVFLVWVFPSSIYPEFISNSVLMPKLHIKINDNLSKVFLLLSKFCHNKNKRRTILSQSL